MLPCIGIVTINIGSISNFAYFINFWCLLTINNKYIENPFLIEPQQNTYKYSYTCINSLLYMAFYYVSQNDMNEGKKIFATMIHYCLQSVAKITMLFNQNVNHERDFIVFTIALGPVLCLQSTLLSIKYVHKTVSYFV